MTGKGNTFCYLISSTEVPSENGVTLKGNNLLPLTPFQKKGETVLTVVSPENV